MELSAYISANIKRLRKVKNLSQKQVAMYIEIAQAQYSVIEIGNTVPTLVTLEKIAKFFNMSIDDLVNFEGEIPNEVTFDDKNTIEQMQLIQQLDEEDKNMIFRMVDKMLTNKKFKDFFAKNAAAL